MVLLCYLFLSFLSFLSSHTSLTCFSFSSIKLRVRDKCMILCPGRNRGTLSRNNLDMWQKQSHQPHWAQINKAPGRRRIRNWILLGHQLNWVRKYYRIWGEDDVEGNHCNRRSGRSIQSRKISEWHLFTSNTTTLAFDTLSNNEANLFIDNVLHCIHSCPVSGLGHCQSIEWTGIPFSQGIFDAEPKNWDRMSVHLYTFGPSISI